MPASTTSAPELTREQVQAILVQPLQAASVFLAAGPRIFDVTASCPVRIPTLVGMTAPSWHGENELLNEAEADFGEVVLFNGAKMPQEPDAPFGIWAAQRTRNGSGCSHRRGWRVTPT